ncbi:MAG: permease prefix domain 1-containing protein, partial [Ruminococcus sp.]|nr:permease prefix domain 1-containing protein [Ruminococcus sp.]
MSKQVEAYINSLIPQSVPKKDRELIHDELACHIYDRIDFFMEIGYDEQASTHKAIEEFGAAKETRDSIKNRFDAIYDEPLWMAVVAGVVTLAVNALGFLTIIYGLGEAGNPIINVKEAFFSALGSFVGIYIILAMAISAYKNGHKNVLAAIGASHAVTILISFLLNGKIGTPLYAYEGFISISRSLLYTFWKITSVSFRTFENIFLSPEIDYLYTAVAVIFTVWCFAAAYVMAKDGINTDRKKFSIAKFSSVFFII